MMSEEEGLQIVMERDLDVDALSGLIITML
jgi:hypothetical protein